MLNRKRRIWAGLATMLMTAPLVAQRPTDFPVIVVFQENIRFQDFLPFGAPDDRDRNDPQAWVYLNRGVVGAVHYLERRRGFRANHVFSHALQGFSARLTAEQIRQLEVDSLIRHIEADGTATISAQTVPWGIDRTGGPTSSTRAGDGQGIISKVNVYVIDTGVGNHPDLNKVGHVNFAKGKNNDCSGHGTHVAGTIAARDNDTGVVGLAPGAPVTGVKVLGCSGTGATSDVIKGIDWVTANRVLPAVANMSLGCGASDAVDEAVRRSVASGVFYAVAAGNAGTDACIQSPARAGAGTNGITSVAAVDSNDEDPYWSNYGSCVDMWAPGVGILSTSLDGGTATMSGTSMASPHVAGTAALYLSTHPTELPATVESILRVSTIDTGKMSNGSQSIRRVFAGAY